MPSLGQEIDAITADRAAVDHRSPGFLWGDNGRKLTTSHSREAIAQERARQAEAIYWKDWFWIVRAGHVIYPDEADAAER